MTREYFVPCSLGLESALTEELKEIGVSMLRTTKGGVGFRGDPLLAYRVCLWTRIGIRVQEQLLAAEVHKPRSLYNAVQRIRWSEIIHPKQTLAVHGTVRDSRIRDGRYAGLLVKDAICDQLRDELGSRPNVDRHEPDVPLKLVLRNNQVLLYRDLAGESLHRRGYRPVQVKSPMNEALAAGLLRMCGWTPDQGLVDPMCGSGTFLIEAALMAGDQAPGLQRTFAFEEWIDTDEPGWEAIVDEAKERAAQGRSKIPVLFGADRHGGAVDIAQQSAEEAGVSEFLRLRTAEVARYEPSSTPAFVVVNPPYGVRIGDPGDIEATWRDLGQFLKRQCPGATAWVLCGNAPLTRHLRMKASQKYPVNNGPIDCRWVGYQIREAAPPAE